MSGSLERVPKVLVNWILSFLPKYDIAMCSQVSSQFQRESSSRLVRHCKVPFKQFMQWSQTKRLEVKRLESVTSTRYLPPLITHLTFDGDFNQRLSPGVLPWSIRHLTFGSEFNQPLATGVLPSNLIELTCENKRIKLS